MLLPEGKLYWLWKWLWKAVQNNLSLKIILPYQCIDLDFMEKWENIMQQINISLLC